VVSLRLIIAPQDARAAQLSWGVSNVVRWSVSTVALPRWVVGLLVGACAVSVVAVAFLLGRVSAPAPVAAPTGVEAAGPSTAGRVSDASIAASTGAENAGEASGQGLAPGPSTPAEPTAGGDTDAAAVAAYFSQMDALSAGAKTSQDPQALARSVLEQAMSGNTSAIEGLIATQRSLETRLGQIAPPPSCREHHQRSVRLFGRAIALLERTRDVMSGQGTADLAGVAGEGRAIETEAKALDSLANDLRRAAGLATLP